MKYTAQTLIDALQKIVNEHGDITISNELELIVSQKNGFYNLNIIAGPEQYFRARVPSWEPGQPPGPIIKFLTISGPIADTIKGAEALGFPLDNEDKPLLKYTLKNNFEL